MEALRFRKKEIVRRNAMKRVGFEPEVITPTLELGLLADRTVAILSRFEEGPYKLTDRDRTTLSNARDFIKKALAGGDVLETGSMRNYTYEAMSAYQAASKALREEEKPSEEEVRSMNSYFRDIARALDATEKDEPYQNGWSAPKLKKCFQRIINCCLQVTRSSIERNTATERLDG
jgi:hypothetical protein